MFRFDFFGKYSNCYATSNQILSICLYTVVVVDQILDPNVSFSCISRDFCTQSRTLLSTKTITSIFIIRNRIIMVTIRRPTGKSDIASQRAQTLRICIVKYWNTSYFDCPSGVRVYSQELPMQNTLTLYGLYILMQTLKSVSLLSI